MKNIINFLKNTLYGNGFTSVLRIIMGLLFIYSGFFKALDPETYGNTILLYEFTPEILMPYGAIILPYLELLLGILLFIGYRIKPAAFLSSILMIFWTALIAISIYRGKSFDCGCFELNRYGIKEEIGFPLVFRDIIFLGILLVIFYAQQHVFSIDKQIEKTRLENL